MLKIPCRLTLVAAFGASLAGCASIGEKSGTHEGVATVVEAAPSIPRSPADLQKINDLERQLTREQRLCLAERRRLELALKESQKQSEDLQKKIDALLAIDRDLRNRSRNH